MRKKLGYSAFFLLCLCFGLILNMPVTHLLAQVKLPPNIRLSGVDGSILHGQIHRLSIDRVLIDNIDYEARTSCLFSLQVCYWLDFDQGHGHISANIIDQSLGLEDFQIEYPLANLSAYADKLLVQPSGNLLVDVDSMSVMDNKLQDISGKALWQEAGVAGESINLGDYELTLNSVKQAYQFTLRDKKAELSVDGKGELKSNGQYTANISIESQPGLNNQIKTALEFIAKKQGLNRYNIRRNGKLPNHLMSQISFPE